jgi:hypothetical protein
MKTAYQLIEDERAKQIEMGYTAQHDNLHVAGDLSLAAACYAAHPLQLWVQEENHNSVTYNLLLPFDDYKIRATKTELETLVIAAALAVAEIEKILRVNGKP